MRDRDDPRDVGCTAVELEHREDANDFAGAHDELVPLCPYCGRVMSRREHAEQGACNDCHGGAA